MNENRSQSSETENTTSEENVLLPAPAQDEAPTTSQSASARKIGASNGSPTSTLNENGVSGYRIIDMAILSIMFKMLPCKECFDRELTLVDDITQRMGCASCLALQCNTCGWTETFYTSERVGHYFQVNRRMVYAMRSIGCGLSAMKRFCTTMNMPPPVGTKPYASHTKAILRAAKDVAEMSTNDAAKEIHNSKTQNAKEIVKTAVSCDGTWQRRGFSSLHGCVTAISMETGKVLDVEPLSKVCQQCKKHEADEETVENRLWKTEHAPKCKANYIVVLHQLWSLKELSEFLTDQSALIIFIIMNFMEMETVRVLVLFKISIKKIMMWLKKRKNVLDTSKNALGQHYEN